MSLPKSDRLILTSCCQMASFMRIPAQSETFFGMSDKLHLWSYMACRITWVFRSVPNHDSTVRAHCCYYIGILWLVSGFVDLALMVNLLYNVELHFHICPLLGCTTTMTTNFFSVFIVVGGIGSDRLRKLYVGNLEIVLGFAGSVSTNEKTVGGVILVWDPVIFSALQRSQSTICLRLFVR